MATWAERRAKLTGEADSPARTWADVKNEYESGTGVFAPRKKPSSMSADSQAMVKAAREKYLKEKEEARYLASARTGISSLEDAKRQAAEEALRMLSEDIARSESQVGPNPTSMNLRQQYKDLNERFVKPTVASPVRETTLEDYLRENEALKADIGRYNTDLSTYSEEAAAMAGDNESWAQMLGYAAPKIVQQEIDEKTGRIADNEVMIKVLTGERNSDFGAMSRYNPSVADQKYRFINGEADSSGGSEAQLAMMGEAEIARYNYLVNTGDTETAERYIELLMPTLKQREYASAMQDAAEFAERLPIIASVASVPANLVGGVTGMVGNIGSQIVTGEVDETAWYNRPTSWAGAARTVVSEGIEDPVLRFMYDTTMSTADFAAQAAIGGGAAKLASLAGPRLTNMITASGVSRMLMSSSAATNAIIEAKQNGLSDEDAMFRGVLAAALENFTEKYSLEVILASPKSTLSNLLRSAAAEGSEEVASNVLNRVAETLTYNFFDENAENEFVDEVKMRVANGSSGLAALVDTIGTHAGEYAMEDIKAGLAGAISGAAAHGGFELIGASFGNYGKQYLESGKTADELIETALADSGNAEAFKLAESMRGGKTPVNNYTVGELLFLVVNPTVTPAVTLEDASQKYSSEASTMRNAYKEGQDVGEYDNAFRAAVEMAAAGENEESIRERSTYLTDDQRETAVNAGRKLAAKSEAAQKTTDGVNSLVKKLTREENMALGNSKYGQRVYNEMNPDNIAAGDYASEWTKSIGTERVNADVYNLAIEDADGDPAVDGDTVTVTGTDTENTDTTPGNVAKISSIENGNVTVKMENGAETNVRDADISIDDAVSIENIASIDGISTEDANFIFKALKTNTGISAQVASLGAKEAYTYGFYGFSQDHIGKYGVFANSLTDSQRTAIYNAGRDARQRQIDSTNPKTRTGTGRQTEIYFDSGNGNIVAFRDAKTSQLTDKQKVGVQAAMILRKLGIGGDIYFFESYRNSKGQLVYTDANGVERLASNGWYSKDGSIHIDLNAGKGGEGFVLFTMAHELTHFIEQWSPAKYKALADFLIENYEKGESMDALVRRKQKKLSEARGTSIPYKEAYSEVVSDSMEAMLADGNVLDKLIELKAKDNSLFTKMKQFFDNLLQKIRSVYKGQVPDSAEGRMVMEMTGAVEKIQQFFAEALVDASENYQAGLTPGQDSTVYAKNGDIVAHATEDGSVQLSMRTYEEEGRTALREYLEKCVSSNKLTKAEMQEMMDGIEEIYQVCKEFKYKYAPFGSWSDAAVVRDTYGKPVFSVVTPNGDYKMNLDFSLVCKKRRSLDAVFNEMAKRGIIDDFELGQKSVVKINEIIRKHGFETACALCFVDAKRFRQASMADSFVNLYNELVNSLVPEEKRGSIDHFNFAGNESIKSVSGSIDTWSDSDLDFSHIDNVMSEYGKSTVEYKAAKYIKENAKARRLLQRGDFMSSKGFDAVKEQNKDILKLYNSKKGTGGPKAAFGDVQYMNEIIKKAKSWTSAKAYAVGGVRIQSFSDYVPRMVFDYVQMIYDLAATKLPAHAYTKEAAFAKQFGLTGVKINMSLIPAIVKGGIAPGLDANGNYVWAGESFDFETAKQIQNADGYTENCGTICVGVSDMHIRKLLADPDIRMVIPYHKSGLNPIVAHMNRIAEFTDYTNSQNTLDKEGKKVAKDFDFNSVLRKSGDPKAAINEYMAWCDSNGYTPKFSQFRDHPNYYKLIEDFTLYDKNGSYVPQHEVRAIFPTDASAFGSMKSLIEAGLQEDAVIEGKRDKSLSSIVDEIESTLPKTEADIPETEVQQADRDLESEVADAGVQYSTRVTDDDTLAFLNGQETITTYKTMQVVDGKLYPPMASRIDGKYEDYSELGVWEQATEHPELIKGNGKFKLDKGKGQGSIDAAYNPYMHSSNLVINDQFSGAYKRDNLVTVECVVPVSEATSGYHAKYAKDTVGWHPWHTGTVAGSIRKAKGVQRQVFLSRWIKPVRIVPDSEVASMYQELLSGTDIAVPDNVVTPSLLEELKKAGVNIEESGRVKYSIREFDSSAKKIENNTVELARMSSVYDVPGSKLSKTGKRPTEIFEEHFDSWGNNIYSEELGDIAVKKSSVKSEVRHGITAEKIASIEAIPTVIKKGKVIFAGIKEGSDVQRIVVCAPIKIGVNSYYMGVMLQRDTQNQRLYLHNVAIEKEAVEFSQADLLTTGADESNEYLFITNILQNALSVKYKMQDMQTRFSDRLDESVSNRAIRNYDSVYVDPHTIDPVNGVTDKNKLIYLVNAFDKNGYMGRPIVAIGSEEEQSIALTGSHRIFAAREAGINIPVVYIEYDSNNPLIQELTDAHSDDERARIAADLYEEGTISKSTYDLIVREEDLNYENYGVPYSDQVRFSDRLPDSVSNRALLANAFEGVAQNDNERSKIQEYKGKIDLINTEEQKLQDLNGQIKELSFAKGQKDTKKIRSLQFEARQTANRINTYDRQLLRLEASKPLQDVLKREKQAAYKRAEQKGKQALAAYRDRVAKTQRELITRYQDARKKGVESRNKTEMRHKIKNVVSELNQYLLNGTKDKHVMIELQKSVAEALDVVNMDTVGAEQRIAKLKDDLLKAKTPEQIQEIAKKIERVQAMGDKMDARLQKLKSAYADIKNSDDPLVANSHDEVVERKIEAVVKDVGYTPLRDMSLSQLEDVYDLYKMVLTTIRDANRSFKNAQKQTISILAGQVMMEVEETGGKKKYRLKGTEGISKFDWNNLKPVYAFSRIGSKTISDIFDNVRSGEDTWAKDVSEAREYYLAESKKYSYDSWDFDTQYKFTSASGMDFSLTLDQIMSLYAYSKRDQAGDHLKYGGFVFDPKTEVYERTLNGKIKLKYNVNEATAYNLSEETLASIIGTLTPEQKGFVDEMQDYLSTTMGAKGNEVSLALYGVKLFKEKYYFPLKSAPQFMAKAKEQAEGKVKIKNSGFSKETTPKAKNPIVLSSFMDVWANHVNEMSMYHAFVLPMEDFYRVYHYKTPTSDSMATESVEMFIQNAYGEGATGYIEQLLNDLNGGARTDSTTGIINKGMGLFKKGAVFASLSVVIQQPSAIARAAALVDTKYFIGPKVDGKRHKALWAEVKQYAPVAIIKEMGYFDTGMGASTADFIQGKEYSGFSEKMKALVKDSNYRDEILSKAPSLADEVAWCGIWEAVKRETAATRKDLKVGSEAFLEAAGKRFTEVIVKTQVYDSVLSRSALMRSKDTGMKMATAFMAEPTTSMNMIEDALIQGKRGNWRYARKAIGSVIAAQILNSILVSFVYAGRDDDEDKSYWEKYLGTLVGELLDSLNPATYIPFIKDIVSIMQGYDVERSDMAIISDLWNAWENLGKDNVSAYRKVEGFAGSIAQIFGLPVKNIMRDVRGMYQTVMSFVDGQQTTAAGIGYAIKEGITGKAVSNQQQLYEAYLSGDKTQISRTESRYKDQDAVHTAMRQALRENDPRIREAAVAWNENNLDEYMRIARSIIAEGQFVQDDVVMAIRAEANSLLEKDDSSSASKANGYFTADKFAIAISQGDQAMANAIRTDIIQTAQKNGKTEEEAEKSFNSSAKSVLKDMYLAGEISDQAVIDALTTYCGLDEDSAAADVQYWAFTQEYPDVYADDAWFDKYYAEVASSGIAIDVYMEYRNLVKDITGDGKKERRMAVIHSLPITSAQKDALYLSEGWAENKLYEAPWH